MSRCCQRNYWSLYSVWWSSWPQGDGRGFDSRHCKMTKDRKILLSMQLVASSRSFPSCMDYTMSEIPDRMERPSIRCESRLHCKVSSELLTPCRPDLDFLLICDTWPIRYKLTRQLFSWTENYFAKKTVQIPWDSGIPFGYKPKSIDTYWLTKCVRTC